MKKHIFVLLISLVCMATTGHTQTYDLFSQSNSKVLDTVTDAGTRVLYVAVIGKPSTVRIDYTCTKISGTVGGLITPVVSNDAVKWYRAAVIADSNHVTPTNVASQGSALYPYSGFRFYGVQWTGTGTMAASIHSKVTYK